MTRKKVKRMNKSKTLLFSLVFLFLFGGSVFGEEPEVKKEFYDSGKLKLETHYINGKKEGLETGWTEWGTKLYLSHYKNGKPDGLTTRWFWGTGMKKLETHFVDGKQNGVRKDWHPSGRKKIGRAHV